MTDTAVRVEEFGVGTSPSALRRRHLRFKAHAAAVLLREASRRNPCQVFEQTMVKAGLNAIRTTHDPQGRYRKQVKVVGETTVERFEEWKRRTERYLMFMAVDHGYSHEEHREILREAGFRTDKPETVSVKVRITLEVRQSVRAYPDDGAEELGAKLANNQVARAVYDRLSSRGPSGAVSWEVMRDA